MKKKVYFSGLMGCLKLTYNQHETPLKVVHRADGQQEKVVQRFISPDPLAQKYYEWSPYNYVLNNPLLYVDPDGKDVWIYYKEISTKGGIGVNAGAYYQWGHANDNYGITYFKASGAQFTDASSGNVIIGGDVDIIEGGIGYDWKNNSFKDYINRVKYITVSAGPIDLSFDDGFVMISGGVSAGIALGRIYTDNVTSYSLSKEDNSILMKKTGSDVIIDNFTVKNFVENKDEDGNIISKTGELYIKNYNGESEINLGITVTTSGDNNMWVSINYTNLRENERY